MKKYLLNKCSDSYPDGSVDVYQNLVIPPNVNLDIFKINNLYGNLTIENPNFKSFPKTIYGTLTMANLGLKKIDNFPSTVSGLINLSYNELESVDFLPQEIFGDLILSNNNIKNIQNFPKLINGDLNLLNNPIEEVAGDIDIKCSLLINSGELLNNFNWKYEYTTHLLDNELKPIIKIQALIHLLASNKIKYSEVREVKGSSYIETLELLKAKLSLLQSMAA